MSDISPNGGNFMGLMGLFKKKKAEDSPAFREQMAKRIARHRLRYITEREGETDLIIGRDGGFNIRDGEFIISADNHVVFRCKVNEMQASELLSLEGAIITAPDLENGGIMRTVIAYYVYFR
jgi:hypothetical protein